MSKPVKLFSLVMAAALCAATPLLAQDRTAISGAQLDAAVVVAQPRGNRAAIQEVLASPNGQQAAARFGLSRAEVSSRVEALDQATIDRLAERTAPDTQVLAGGADTIVVSTTAIIIALLLIILLVD